MGPTNFSHALVRPPGASFVNAIATVPQPIDVTLALQQHGEYVAALQTAGVQVEILPAEERYPDSCFMQDAAMVVAGTVILNRMGVESRAGETALAAEVLSGRFPTHRIQAPGTLEGGDVLNLGQSLLVGETARSNAQGIDQLCAIVAGRGIAVQAIPLQDYLHLLTVVTYLGHGVVLVHEDFADHPGWSAMRRVIVPRQEAYAANTLGIGNHVILPAGFPKTMERIRAEGFELLPVPMSEFYKADGGVSCLSLIW